MNGGPGEPAPADKARIAAIAEDLDGGEPSAADKKKGIGKPPSAKDRAEAMELFREVNGGPDEPSPEQKAKGIGKPPSAKDRAEAMELVREVNGGPDDAKAGAPKAGASTTNVGAATAVNGPEVRASTQQAHVAPQFNDITPEQQRANAARLAPELDGGSPAPADKARIAAIAEDLDGGEPSAADRKKGIGKPPSEKDRAEAMELFREVNGGPDEPSPEQKAKGIGKPPSAKDRAEAMELFREVNGGPGEPAPDVKARAAALAPELDGGADEAKAPGAKKKTVGVPSAEGRAEALELFREVNGGPANASAAAVNGPEIRASAQQAHVAPQFGDLTPASAGGVAGPASVAVGAAGAAQGAEKVGGFEVGMNVAAGGAPVGGGGAAGGQASANVAGFAVSFAAGGGAGGQAGHELDPAKRMANVAIHQVEHSLDAKAPAQKKKDDAPEKHEAPEEQKAADKIDDKKPELEGHDEKVKDAKQGGADHVHHLDDQLHAKNARDARNLTLDAKLKHAPLAAGAHEHADAQNKPHLIDGHATGLIAPIHAKPLATVDGHGTGLVDDKQGSNHKVELDKQAKNPHGEIDEHIADSEGNVQKYNPMSGKAPVPQAKGHATGAGFAKPAPKPELPPPPQTANQQALSAFIEKARADRDAARKSVKATQLAKSTAVTVDAAHLKQQVEAKNAAKLAEIKKQADADKAKAAQEAAEKQKNEGPVTLDSLKEKLEAKATEDRTKLKTDFDAKNAELKTRLDSQKAVLKDQVDAQIAQVKKDQDAKKAASEKAFADQKKSLEATRDALVTEIRKNVAKDQTALEKEMQKGGKLWTAADAKIAEIEKTSQANQTKTHDEGYAKADAIQKAANDSGAAERANGAAAAAKARADVMATKTDDDDGILGDARLQAQANSAAATARIPFDQRARDLETKGKLDCTSMKSTIDGQVKKLKTDGEAAVKAVKDATAGQVTAIEGKIKDLSKIADGRIKKAEDDYTANVAKKQAELQKAIEGFEGKIQALKTEGDQKIAKLETDAVAKLQKDYDVALKAIDTRVQVAEKQLAASNGKNLKALEQVVNQTCAAIDKQVVETEKKFDHTVQDADKQAFAFITAQLAKIQKEAQHALDAIDKTYQECLKMADDAVEAAHRQLEETSKGKMLEIEVHIGTLMKDCGDSSRYDAAHAQLEYYVKQGKGLPSGYGESAPPPPSTEAKKEDPNKPAAAGDDKSAANATNRPAEPKKEDDPVSSEMKDLKAEQEKQKKLLESNDLSDPAVLEAHVQDAMKKGQTATGAAAAANAQQSLKTSMAQASETVQKAFNTKAEEMKKVEAGDATALKEVREQERAEDDAKKRADEAKKAMDKPGMLWGKNPDKKAVLKSMEGMTPAEAEAFKEEMKKRGVDIEDFVNKELPEEQKTEALLRLKGDDVGADIAALNAAKGHHMTGNEKLALTIGAGVIMGPFGAVAAGSATSSDQNIGADKQRINELLDKYKDNPEKLNQLKKALEADGVSIAQLCHETGNDDLGKQLDPEHQELNLKPADMKAKGQADADAYLAQHPDLNTNASQAKLQAAVDKAEQSLHYILDSSKNEGIANALKDLTPEEAEYVKAKYRAQTGHDLEADMNKQLSGVGLSTAKASLRADKDTLELNKILGAEEAGWTNYTLDDDKMKAAMKDLKDPVQRQKVLDAYERKTGRKLTDVLNQKMSGNDRDIAVAYANGDVAKAAAAEADEALNGGWMNSMHRAVHDRTKQFTGKDIDTEAFTRPLVGALVNPASLLTPSMDKDTKVNLPGGYEMQSGAIHKVDTDKLLEIMESMPDPADREKFKAEYKARTGHDLDDDVKQKTSGVTQGAFDNGKPSIKFDAYKALDDGRMDDYYAAKMDDAVDGMNDSKAFHKCLEGKSERERAAIIAAYQRRHPDDPDAFNDMIADQFGKGSLDYQKAQLLATSKDDPKTGAVKLPDDFVIRYAEDSVWSRTAKAIDGATEIFDKYPFLYAIPVVGATAGEAKAASYFMRGWGVDKDAIKEVLKGKSKAEIDEIRKKYKDAGGDLDADLGYVLDGRDGFEVKLMLEEGEPTTDKARIERQMKLYNFDRGHDGGVWDKMGMSSLSNGITDLLSPAGRQMDDHAAEMQRLLAMCGKDGKLPASEQGKLGAATGGMDAATQGFIEARGEITNAVATAAGAIVGAVVTVLTGGAAAPLLAALATGLTTVAVKAVMLGNSYGRSELGVDLAMTVVQVATAGLGGSLGEFGKTFLGQVLNGAIGAAASNFAQTAMTSADAHDLLNLLAQASKSGLVGMLSGGANAGATAALGHAMESLSETAFGRHAPLGGIMIKGMVTGAGSSLAGTFAEAIVDPDSLKGDWDKVFAKLAQGAAQGAMQNALNDVASAHAERVEAVTKRAKEAIAAVREKNGGVPNVAEEHAAFAKAMAEGYDAVVRDEAAAEAAKKQQAADPNKVEQQLENNPKPVASEDRVVNPNEDKHAQAAKEDKVGPHQQSPEEIRQKMEQVAAAAKEQPAQQEKAQPAQEEHAAATKKEEPVVATKPEELPAPAHVDDVKAAAGGDNEAQQMSDEAKEAKRDRKAWKRNEEPEPTNTDVRGMIAAMGSENAELPGRPQDHIDRNTAEAIREGYVRVVSIDELVASGKAMIDPETGRVVDFKKGTKALAIGNTIYIDPTLPPHEIRENIRHEVNHALHATDVASAVDKGGLGRFRDELRAHLTELGPNPSPEDVHAVIEKVKQNYAQDAAQHALDGGVHPDFENSFANQESHGNTINSIRLVPVYDAIVMHEYLGVKPSAAELDHMISRLDSHDRAVLGGDPNFQHFLNEQAGLEPHEIVHLWDKLGVADLPATPEIDHTGFQPKDPKERWTTFTDNAAEGKESRVNADDKPAHQSTLESGTTAHEEAGKVHQQEIAAAQAKVSELEAKLAAIDPATNPAEHAKAKEAVEKAVKNLEGTKETVANRDKENAAWHEAKQRHQAEIELARAELQEAHRSGDEQAIQAAQEHLDAVRAKPVIAAPEGHEMLSDLAKAALDGAGTPADRKRLEEVMNQVYGDVRGRDPAAIAKDPAALQALMEYHVALAGISLQEGQDVRKVMPKEAMDKLIRGVDRNNNPVESLQTGGCVGDPRNTMNLTPHEVVAALGLDYHDTQWLQAGGKPGEMKGVSSVAILDVPITAQNKDQVATNAKIPMDKELIAAVKKAAAEGNPTAKKLLEVGLVEHNVQWHDPLNPYAGPGMSTAGPRMGGAREHLSLNQEREAQYNPGAHDGGQIDIPNGSKLKIKLESGQEIVIATFQQEMVDGKPAFNEKGQPKGKFVLEPDLPPQLREKYEGMQKSQSDIEQKFQQDKAAAGSDKAKIDALQKERNAQLDALSGPRKDAAPLEDGGAQHAIPTHGRDMQEVRALLEVERARLRLENPGMNEEQIHALAKQNVGEQLLQETAREGAEEAQHEKAEHRNELKEKALDGYGGVMDDLAGRQLQDRVAPEELAAMKTAGDYASIANMVHEMIEHGGIQATPSKALAEGVVAIAGQVIEHVVAHGMHAPEAAEMVSHIIDVLKIQAVTARPDFMERVGDIMKAAAAGDPRKVLELAVALAGKNASFESAHNRKLIEELLRNGGVGERSMEGDGIVDVSGAHVPDDHVIDLRTPEQRIHDEVQAEHADKLAAAKSDLETKKALVQVASDEDFATAVKDFDAARKRLEILEGQVKAKEDGRVAKHNREQAKAQERELAQLELEVARERKDPLAIERAEARLRKANEPGLPSMAERTASLVENRGVCTYEAFTVGELPKEYDQRRAFLLDPKNWTPERQAFHKEVLAKALEQALTLAAEVRAARGADSDESTLFAMRGNTAAGKSRSVTGEGGPAELAQAMKNTGKGGRSSNEGEELRHRAINPDNFKNEIYEHDPHLQLTSNQAHEESSILAEWLQQALLRQQHENGTPVDMVVDKRLAWMDEVQKLIQESKTTGRELRMIDVDAELTTSFAGVLDRDGVSNPIPKADNIAGGFEQIRGNRLETIKALAAEPHAGYQLFGTLPNGQKVLIAEMKPMSEGEAMPANPLERLKITPEYREMFANVVPRDAEELQALKEHSKVTQNTVITEQVIEEMTAQLEPKYRDQMRAKLARHIGKTWKEAVDTWSQTATSSNT
ncbi:MAG TPA: hypothetical protein VLT45_28875 [Kofleriaceae bacterium]|nr:hypothetical protein [Kofleriaceae bacterium]